MPKVKSKSNVDEFERKSGSAWLNIIDMFNGPNYECHQRFCVFIDCFTYGFPYGESFDCARTCENLPRVVFEWDGIKSPEVPKYRGKNA